jgi:hypothetical protein
MTSPHLRTSILSALTVVLLTVLAAAQTRSPFDGIKPFQGMGTIDPTTVAVNIMCSDGNPGTRLGGSLKGNDIGTGTYTLCLDVQIGPHQSWSPGTLTFTEEDGVSTFTMNVSTTRLSNYQATATYLGTYDLDPNSPRGKFAGRLTGGSGLLELSRPSRLLYLNGLVKSD